MITVAKNAGFCFGVKRAVDMVFDLTEKGENIATLGEIIHNPQINAQLSEKGVRIANSPADVADADTTIVVRSHGVAKSVMEDIAARGFKCIDATCPFVKKIHHIVETASAENKTVLIAGDCDHPEVQGIIGYCSGEWFSFKTVSELRELLDSGAINLLKKAIIVAQTTFNMTEWEKCTFLIKKLCTNVEIFDTICSATDIRQKEAAELAQQVEAMIVVGGRHSSNTAKLRDICDEFCPTFLIESAAELKDLELKGYQKIGVTAGASTPALIIKEVQTTMAEILENNTEEVSFEELLNQTFKSTYTGEKVIGIVTGIAPTEVSVEIGTKHTGYIPLHELTDDPSLKPEDIVQVGQTLNLKVLRVNDVEGTMVLSKRQIDSEANLERVLNAAETGEIFEGTVVDVVKGGVITTYNGVRVFIPASQATLNKTDSLEALLKQKVRFKILEANAQRKRAVGSIRSVLLEERRAATAKFWEDIKVGDVFNGTVKSLTSYGAFVDLGGVDGMVHISELSWQRIKHPSDVVKVGDVLEVYVKDLDPENKKISLGYMKTSDNPWEILREQYPVDTVVKVKIVSITTFGAFAQIIPGIDGLIHISQLSNERVAKPADV
ncbi:MAG: bifunctional 4-hydroxy-3-methylbut-2-enyl diphosphate reductase/30S ribosomal protein S1, partial [Oscillospiraceae bacterium]|nr:bifunctional 4-hydroxy-3-methylbut-2-enyl diphosphate reductase/30S ribosomal protein S1 [Oscillospiraceae bacterium]